MAGTLVSFMASGVPAYIANSLTNIYTPPAAAIRSAITQIHVVNTSNASCWFSLYIGGTGAGVAGTEWFKTQTVTAQGLAGSVFDFYTERRMDSTNFLVGIAQTASVLTIDVMGYQYVAG